MATIKHSVLAVLSWLVKIIASYFTWVQLERIETTDSYQSYVNMPSVSASMCAVVWSALGMQILEPSLHLTSSLQTTVNIKEKCAKKNLLSSHKTVERAQGLKVWTSFISHTRDKPCTWIQASHRVCTM